MSSRFAHLIVAAIFAVSLRTARPFAADGLKLYFIDVEGGQSTLVVTPAGQSLLVDAGFPGSEGTFGAAPGEPARARDAQRIVAAARDAGAKQIDYLFLTHFHADHDGGVPELAQLIPIRTFVDHGTVSDAAETNVPGTLAAFQRYVAARGRAKHVQPRPGDRLPLQGATATVVSAAGAVLPRALIGGGARNDRCGPPLPAQEPHENPRSNGLLLQYGRFRFLDVGDLTGPPLYALFCPSDLIGPVDVYLLPHHGGLDAADPALFGVALPRVAIVDNGERKGGAPELLSALHALPSIDVWQLHRSANTGANNYAEERIANLDTSTAHWIKVVANEDGSFAVTNGRTGATKMYQKRQGSSAGAPEAP